MAYIIPTYFTAVNSISPVVAKIGSDLGRLGSKAAAAQAQMNAMVPSFGGVGASMKNMLPSLAAGGVILALGASGKAVMDYGTEISNLSAVTGATGTELDLFKNKITQVAKETKRSTVQVAQAFTAVDNNMPELHKLPEALAEVTKQTIILGKASRMDLAPAAEAMTMIMNQFSLKAGQAAHVVDVLAAGAVYGSSRIAETAEALQKFGATAKNTVGSTFEESVALVELASKFEKGAEAGTRLRNIELDLAAVKAKPELADEMSRLGVNIELVTSKTADLTSKLNEMGKMKGNTELLLKLFDKRNINMASGLINRLPDLPKIMNGLKAEGMGARMADTNTNNLRGSIDKLVASWVTLITTSEETNVMTTALSGTIKVLADNLSWLAPTVLLTAQAFYGVKLALWLTVKATVAFDYTVGLLSYKTLPALNTGFAMSISSINGFAVATKLASISMWGWIGIIGGTAAALGILYSRMTDDYDAAEEMRKSLDKTKDGFKQIRQPITDAQIALAKYNKAMDEYNESQDFRAHVLYERKRGFFHELSYRVLHPFASEQMSQRDAAGNPTPNKSDFPAIDTTAKPTITAENPVSANSNSDDLLKQIRDGIYNLNGGRRAPSMPGRSTTGSYA